MTLSDSVPGRVVKEQAHFPSLFTQTKQNKQKAAIFELFLRAHPQGHYVFFFRKVQLTRSELIVGFVATKVLR